MIKKNSIRVLSLSFALSMILVFTTGCPGEPVDPVEPPVADAAVDMNFTV